MSTTAASSLSADGWTRRRVLIWGGVICLATLALRTPTIFFPGVWWDDFGILEQSWTWTAMRANLWAPANEHSMPLGRLSTWLLIRLAGDTARVPQVVVLQGPLALVAAAVLAYLFVRREVGHPLPALVAMALFGVSTHYQQAISWFAASFAVLGLDTLLLGLLAAQRWRQTGRWTALILSAFWCALAPGWFGSGVLAGPLCSLYLLGPDRDLSGTAPTWRRRLLAVVPSLGTVISLAITLPHNAERIFNLPRVELPRRAWETLDPRTGLVYTLRSLVDDVLPGALGLSGLTIPQPWVWFCLVLVAVAAYIWWRVACRRNLLLLGAGMILSSYLLIYTVRSYLDYEDMRHWGRYHLYAHLGLVLYLCGAWPRGKSIMVRALVPGWRAAVLLALLFLTQVRRSDGLGENPEQMENLHRNDTNGPAE